MFIEQRIEALTHCVQDMNTRLLRLEARAAVGQDAPLILALQTLIAGAQAAGLLLETLKDNAISEAEAAPPQPSSQTSGEGSNKPDLGHEQPDSGSPTESAGDQQGREAVAGEAETPPLAVTAAELEALPELPVVFQSDPPFDPMDDEDLDDDVEEAAPRPEIEVPVDEDLPAALQPVAQAFGEAFLAPAKPAPVEAPVARKEPEPKPAPVKAKAKGPVYTHYPFDVQDRAVEGPRGVVMVPKDTARILAFLTRGPVQHSKLVTFCGTNGAIIRSTLNRANASLADVGLTAIEAEDGNWYVIERGR